MLLLHFGASSNHARWIGDISVNLILCLFGLRIIFIRGLAEQAGLTLAKPERPWLLASLILLLAPMTGGVFEVNHSTVVLADVTLLLVWAMSIGVFEELWMRGLLQSEWVLSLGGRKNSFLLATLVSAGAFGLLHLIRGSGSAAAELNQVCLATILGVLFGALLIGTRRLYPIVIAHGLLDFFSGLDSITPNHQESTARVTSVPEEFAVTILLLPFLFFAIWQLMREEKARLAGKVLSEHG